MSSEYYTENVNISELILERCDKKIHIKPNGWVHFSDGVFDLVELKKIITMAEAFKEYCKTQP